MTGARALRVVLADDQPAMRAALRTIVEAGGAEVVAEAGDGAAAVVRALDTVPDVVVMDLRMPGRDGLTATAELTARLPGVPVLVVTTFDDDASLFGALRAGAAGFLLKNSSPEDVQAALARVAAGDAVLDPAVLARVMRRAASGHGPADDPPAAPGGLTEREKDVWWLVARGLTNAEVAERLGVGEATAKSHVSSVLTKLGVRDRVQAVVFAYENGVVAPGG